MFYKHFVFWENENIRFVLLIFSSRNTVKNAYKFHLKEIELGRDSLPHPSPYRDGLAVYVLEPGMYQLIFSSRLERNYW